MSRQLYILYLSVLVYISTNMLTEWIAQTITLLAPSTMIYRQTALSARCFWQPSTTHDVRRRFRRLVVLRSPIHSRYDSTLPNGKLDGCCILWHDSIYLNTMYMVNGARHGKSVCRMRTGCDAYAFVRAEIYCHNQVIYRAKKSHGFVRPQSRRAFMRITSWQQVRSHQH